MAIPGISIFWGVVGLVLGLCLRALFGGSDELSWTLFVAAISGLGFAYKASTWLLFMALPFLLCCIIASGHDGFGFWAWMLAGLLLNAFHIHGHSMAVSFAYANGAAYAKYVNAVLSRLEKDNNK